MGVLVGLKIVDKKGDVAGVREEDRVVDLLPTQEKVEMVVYENKELFKQEVLDVDEEELFNSFISAHRNSFNLALNIAYPTKETIPLLLTKAIYASMNLALDANILNSKTIETFISKANLQATVLKSKVKDDAKTEEPKAEEKPAEEKKKEAKTEDKKEELKEEKPAEEKKEAPKEEAEKKEDVKAVEEKKEELKEAPKEEQKKEEEKKEEEK